MADKKDKDPNVRVYSGDKVTSYPKEPSTWDMIKEGFEPTDQRAKLDAVRARRQRQGA
jgi:hypothetical protein